MLECPDIFRMGDHWVVLGSLYQPEPRVEINQWWAARTRSAHAIGSRNRRTFIG